MWKKFLISEQGDTNLVPYLIILGILIIIVMVFKPYITSGVAGLLSMLG